MKLKIIISSAFFALEVVSLNSQINDPVALMYQGRPWEFIGQKFVVEPHKKSNTLLAHLKCLAVGGGAGAVAGYGTAKAVDWFHAMSSPSHCNNVALLRGFAAVLVGGVSAFIGHKLVSDVITEGCNQDSFLNFVYNWPEYRELTPISLHQSFDNFHRMSCRYNGRALLVQHAHEAVETIKRVIYTECDKYVEYQRIDANYSFSGIFTHFLVHFDVARIIEVLINYVHMPETSTHR